MSENGRARINSIKPIATYMLVLLVVLLALGKAQTTVASKGRRMLAGTLTEIDRRQLIEKARATRDLPVLLAGADTLAKHGLTADAERLLKSKLNDNATSASVWSSRDQVKMLRALCAIDMRAMRFEEARAYLDRAASLAKSAGNSQDLIAIADDQVDLASQELRLSRLESARKTLEERLQARIVALSELASTLDTSASSGLRDAGLLRLIENHVRIARIESGRLVELDCFEPEPGLSPD